MTITTFSTLSDYDNGVIEVVKDCIPSLERGVDYISQTIVPASLWSSLDDGERRRFGKVLSRLVDNGLVQLEKTSPRYKMPVTYQRL